MVYSDCFYGLYLLLCIIKIIIITVVVASFIYTCYGVLEFNCCCALKAKHAYSLNVALRYNRRELKTSRNVWISFMDGLLSDSVARR